MQQSTYKQYEYCSAIAFNKDATLLISGCYKLIKVFEFKDEKLREVELLSQHQDTVTCLQFMKKSNQFISASYDSTIIIWEQNQKNQWQIIQVLKSHSSNINCISMNQNEDLLISGSNDKTIKFWQKQNNIWSCNQSFDCKSCVWSISLNGQEDILIASLDNKFIFIIQLQGKQWMIKQKIMLDTKGFRLSFIDQVQFVFQPFDRKILLIYDCNAKDEIFRQGQKLKYSNEEADDNYYFPIRFNSKIGLTIGKHDNHVHVIKRQQNGQFTVQQSIDFGTCGIFGEVTDDGKYLATWDNKSEEIQIRKLEN